MAEQVVQSGRLGEQPLVDLVMSACRMKRPSILRLERGGHTRAFYFRDGELKALVASNPTESLTAMLVRRKKLQASVAEAARDVAVRDGIGEASAIMRDRLLPIPELVKEMNVWATLLMVSSFGWESGSWQIVLESVENAPPDTLLELQLPATLLRGVSKKLGLAAVKGPLEPFFEEAPRRADDPPFPPVAFDLDARQQALLDALDGQRTLRELVSFSPIPEEEALRLLYLLQRLGMLDFGGEAPGMETPRFASQPATRTPAPSAPPPPADESGIDWGAIRFSRREATDRAGHYAAHGTGQAERLSTTGRAARVEVGVGTAPEESEDLPPPSPSSPSEASVGLAGLFDDLDDLGDPSPRPGVKPPRGGRGGGWRATPAQSAPNAPNASAAAEPAAAPEPPPASSDVPPQARGIHIEAADWARMSSKDKDRVRAVVGELRRMDDQNYFQWFGLTPEAPEGAIKKAFFKMARLYHPDSLVDEGDVYRHVAETIFGRYGAAYECLDDAEAKDKYVRKHILGEKDEDELAMEKVQAILAAEGAFRDGLRRLQSGQLGPALKKFKEAVEGYDEEAEYVAYYGYTLFRARVASDAEEADRGIELIKKATELKPMANKPWHLLGKVYLQKEREDPARAKKFLRKALQIKADDAECVRDYRRADELQKAFAEQDDKGGGLLGLFGKLGRKKEPAKKDDGDDFDFDF